MTEETVKTLIEAAVSARKNSYAPYSDYAVGAALLTDDGTVYTGVNVENSSYPVGICAERTAFVKAVSDGRRSFAAIAVVGGSRSRQSASDDFCYPCGLCRQFMAEWCGSDFRVIAAKNTEEYRVLSFGEILPYAFGLSKEQ